MREINLRQSARRETQYDHGAFVSHCMVGGLHESSPAYPALNIYAVSDSPIMVERVPPQRDFHGHKFGAQYLLVGDLPLFLRVTFYDREKIDVPEDMPLQQTTCYKRRPYDRKLVPLESVGARIKQEEGHGRELIFHPVLYVNQVSEEEVKEGIRKLLAHKKMRIDRSEPLIQIGEQDLDTVVAALFKQGVLLSPTLARD